MLAGLFAFEIVLLTSIAGAVPEGGGGCIDDVFWLLEVDDEVDEALEMVDNELFF